MRLFVPSDFVWSFIPFNSSGARRDSDTGHPQEGQTNLSLSQHSSLHVNVRVHVRPQELVLLPREMVLPSRELVLLPRGMVLLPLGMVLRSREMVLLLPETARVQFH